ncbi:MAG: hypothetical protein M3Z04_13605 [Chloroflexota bacterium]|nr:hypothetical protein [Chloroflexota bacterium]
MQDNRSNRTNEGVTITPRTANRANTVARVTPLEQASGMPALPTSRPQRERRATGPINPVYIALITLVPLAILATMLFASAKMFPPPDRVLPGAQVRITPGSELASQIGLTYSPTKDGTHRREGDKVYITGQAKNNTDRTIFGIYLKAFLYRPDALGGQELVGSGVGNAAGDVAPGATVPFTITAQLAGGPAPKAGMPTPPPKDYETVEIYTDQVWGPTPTPQTTAVK